MTRTIHTHIHPHSHFSTDWLIFRFIHYPKLGVFCGRKNSNLWSGKGAFPTSWSYSANGQWNATLNLTFFKSKSEITHTVRKVGRWLSDHFGSICHMFVSSTNHPLGPCISTQPPRHPVRVRPRPPGKSSIHSPSKPERSRDIWRTNDGPKMYVTGNRVINPELWPTWLMRCSTSDHGRHMERDFSFAS